jgi:uncharacterized protein
MSMSDESLPLPAYSFVPGGPWPHPTGSPQGHSFGRERSTLAPIDTIKTVDSAPFLRGIALFNAGYYWEAHDAWESLWHAHGRRGVVADVIKALIKLAAAGVKVREGHDHGVRTHASRAADLFASALSHGKSHQLGLSLTQWVERCRQVAANPPRDHGPSGAPVSRVFEFQIELNPTRHSG